MRRVILESPYAGDIKTNMKYLRTAMRDCLLRGETPFASHALYTQEGVLRDTIPEERELGMTAGWDWLDGAQAVVVYTDLGISDGMRDGIDRAKMKELPIEFRKIKGWENPSLLTRFWRRIRYILGIPKQWWHQRRLLAPLENEDDALRFAEQASVMLLVNAYDMPYTTYNYGEGDGRVYVVRDPLLMARMDQMIEWTIADYCSLVENPINE